MNAVIVGGSQRFHGGVEIFCERAIQAFSEHRHETLEQFHTNTAFFRSKDFFLLLKSLAYIAVKLDRSKVVWLQYGNALDLIYLPVAKIFGHKIVVTPHLGINWRSQRYILFRHFCMSILALADHIAILSDTQQSELILPNSVPISEIRSFLAREIIETEQNSRVSAAPQLTRLVHAGRLSEEKGTFKFLEVCNRLKDANFPFEASMYGACSENDGARISAFIADNALAKSIRYFGQVGQAVLADALRNADILVHLSSIDSFPLIVLEAIGCGTYPICQDLLGARAIVDRYCGIVVSGSDPVAKTLDFITSVNLSCIREESSRSSKAIRGDYSWKECVSRLEPLITG
ncbi:glycosyltransferase family 4 protein [Methylobacterium phyllosphaerae]